MEVVRVQGLVRRYGAVEALRGVSFAVNKGEVVGLLGPNGAGKSTLLRVLTGWLAPTEGSASICGHDTLEAPRQAREHLGYLPETGAPWPESTVRGLLAFVASARGLGAAEQSRAIDKAAVACGLADRLDQRIGTLSKGLAQRAGLAAAILHEPTVLILDEPTAGLDPNQLVEIRALIRELGRKHTVILSTHILPEVQATCDRVLILHDGRLVADGPTAVLTGGGHGHRVTLGLAPGKVLVAPSELLTQLSAIDGVSHVTPLVGEGLARFAIDAREDVRARLFGWAVAHGHVLVELSAERRDLEDVFRTLTHAEGGP